MEAFSPKDSSILSSPYSSPNLSALLKIKVISWSQETGLPVTVRVRVANRSFNLHKSPLTSKSEYFKRQLNEWQEVDLPTNFPGGSETFEMIALFIYGSSTFIDPFNVASLRCAAEFLEMTSEASSGGTGNLCERTDLYLTQVVLQSWDDTLIVLQKCQALLPWAEELLIVSRCIESLAFMACMEILDPERKKKKATVSLEALAAQPWNINIKLVVKEITSSDQDHVWINDLIALPFGFFKRIIGSLRRQGMKEKYVSPIIVFYASKWVINSKKTRQFWECLCDKDDDYECNDDESDMVLETLKGILDLLHVGRKVSKIIPVGFFFALLARSLELGKGGTNTITIVEEGKLRLQQQIAHLLPLAHVEDFLLPKQQQQQQQQPTNDQHSFTSTTSSSVEVGVMECIFSTYVSSNNIEMQLHNPTSMGNTIVGELWDSYLSLIVHDPNMTPKKFMSLVELVPLSYRNNHDHLYTTMNTYILAHPNLSAEEKTSVCKYLNCQKLSQELCVEAVQNELMPLRLIVQALLVQQLNTQHAFKECSESFRFAAYNSREFSGSLSSSRYPNSKSQNLEDITDNDEAEIMIMKNQPLSCCILDNNNDHNAVALQRKPDIIAAARKEYESTSFRIQNLEQELVSLKKNLRLKKKETEDPKMKNFGLEGRSYSSSSKRRNISLGQVTSCIGSVNFSSQRKYAGRLLKIFRRVTLFGRAKLKRRPSVSGS
ncbi:BTB/POZ domain-containing protein At5g48130 [Spinacia oleracea]|uniref:BTB/POZ domain-containing protein At5g48130 n=1 Tax=Spinacia oleracea TaxID=3562 RepID=A0A9R0JCJ5_SPIOL|nr:BTB/POZ domain-containing protein At5g48130 [Spinacia oleracea]